MMFLTFMEFFMNFGSTLYELWIFDCNCSVLTYNFRCCFNFCGGMAYWKVLKIIWYILLDIWYFYEEFL